MMRVGFPEHYSRCGRSSERDCIVGQRPAYHTILLALGLIIVDGACNGRDDPSGQSPVIPPEQAPRQSPVTLSVLFIGNSLTYYHDLPATVAGIAAAAGDDIRVEMVAGPKLSLMDHLQPGSTVEAAIRGGRWDFVVLQQGATTDSASRDTLVLAAERFDTIIRLGGAQPAFYMVWPPADRPEGFCAARAAYQAAASAVGGAFLPVGSAWQDALQQDASLPLYDPDGIHPAPLGTWLAAITIYDNLTGHDGRRIAPQAVVNGARLDLPATTVRMLQEVAYTATNGAGSVHGCNTNQGDPR
jgi:hypothetical protein